jgi:hypothetical protein
MRHRCYLGLGIAFTAAFVALMGGWNETYAKPMAECKNGKCVIDEADWERFKAFHKRVKDVTASVDANLPNAALQRCKPQQERPL